MEPTMPIPIPSKPELFTLIFVFRFLVNAVAVTTLVRLVYFPIHGKKDYYFTFFLLNFLVFVLTYLLNNTNAFGGFGTAIGLLAAFTLLRLRTETISIKDMTYLFIVLTVGLINATMSGPYYELIVLNVVIICFAYVLDSDWLSKSLKVKTIELDTLDNIKPEKQEVLLADLRTRTGLDIKKVDIDFIDLGKGRASIKVYYR